MSGYSVNELSTAYFEVTCEDATGTAIVPNSFTWWLRDSAGEIVNGRDAVTETPANPTVIEVTGEDNALPTNDKVRYITVLYTFDSDIADDRPMYLEIRYCIIPIFGVT